MVLINIHDLRIPNMAWMTRTYIEIMSLHHQICLWLWICYGIQPAKKQQVHQWIMFLVEKLSGWWFGTSILFSHILGMSSSQLTFIFFRGAQTTNQLWWSCGGKTNDTHQMSGQNLDEFDVV